MKNSFLIFILIIFILPSCAQDRESALLRDVRVLSADSMMGREFGTPGNDKAQKYIVHRFKELNLKPAFSTGYLQSFKHKRKEGNNIIAMIPGETDRMIVITAHYDHLGQKKGEIYNGADDNASGTAALFQIAAHFQSSRPHHTLMLAALDAEESGMVGAKHLVSNFPKPLNKVVLNINLDMISHSDRGELYACGTHYYPQLKAPIANINTPVTLKFGHCSPEYKGSDNWTYSSDHKEFHKKEIPFVYFGVEDHEDYHEPSDTYENINHTFYENVVDFLVKAIEAYDSSDVFK
ncbi:MAG: M28 family peptidase [Fulvivirga sp.]|nr:M28 family peptidase [Fulvivirga sp.]